MPSSGSLNSAEKHINTSSPLAQASSFSAKPAPA